MSEQTNNSEYNTVTLSLDDGTECECAIIRIFPAGENDYIALLPLEGEAAEQDEVYLYRYVENDGREPSLLNIESDMKIYMHRKTKKTKKPKTLHP